jgi:hypothetical protein
MFEKLYDDKISKTVIKKPLGKEEYEDFIIKLNKDRNKFIHFDTDFYLMKIDKNKVQSDLIIIFKLIKYLFAN